MHSFGIHVVAMAGMPKNIVNRAMDILHDLEKKCTIREDVKGKGKILELRNHKANYQLSLFNPEDPMAETLKSEIKALDLNTMTPIECMLKLHDLLKIVKENTE